MNSRNEHELIAGAKCYDTEILGEIYDRYSPGIYRYAMRLLGDDFLSEECVSETFSRFLRALRSGQGPGEYLQAYLYRIAHNWITDSYRRLPPPAVEMDETMADSEHPLPDHLVDIRVEQNRVRLALRSLTPEQRQVIALRFMEGWENNAVAAALGKPVGAIKALQFRAIRMLRKMLITEQEKDVYEPEG